MEEIKCEQVGMLMGEKWEKMHDIGRRVYSPDGLAPTQHTCGGGNLETKIVVAVDEQNKALRTDGTVGTLTTDGSSPKHNNRVLEGTLKAQMCEQLIASGAVVENDVIRHSYTRSRMKGEIRDIQQNNMSPTIDTRADCSGVCVRKKQNILLTIFGLCGIIEEKEKEKYENSRHLLQVLWEEVGKKEIWDEIGRFCTVQEKSVLQQGMYAESLYERRK